MAFWDGGSYRRPLDGGTEERATRSSALSQPSPGPEHFLRLCPPLQADPAGRPQTTGSCPRPQSKTTLSGRDPGQASGPSSHVGWSRLSQAASPQPLLGLFLLLDLSPAP